MKTLLTTLFIAVVSLLATAQDELVWFDGQHPVSYRLHGKPAPVLTTAIDMFTLDMQTVTGMRPTPSRRATINISYGQANDDGFSINVRQNHIDIVGHNARGAAYGLLELSRMAGVSPWVWWGDLMPERKQRLTIARDFTLSHTPSVQYRGIFINDEDWSTRPWSSKTYEPGQSGRIGPKTYKRIFQLLLRLRANTIWPAMHEGTTAFFLTEGAKAMADSCGIVVGTSHCEPMLRNNVGEWNVSERGRFNYRTNRQAVQDYWTERLREVRGTDNNIFTIGMRGIHDSSMEGYNSDQEKFDGLQQVIDDQQELLRRHVGEPSRLTQMFVPYKEVLQLYEMGLRVPDYATLLWCDDNYGYMTRFSTPSEQQRQGGAGIYYHLSYWGRPHDYLWLTTTQPGLICNEMHEAYNHGVRRMWIANVHDVKVAGYDLELFLDMAWDIDSAQPSSLQQHYAAWLCRQFGDEAGRQLLEPMLNFWRLCGERKPEFTGWTQVELDKKKYERGLSPIDSVDLSPKQAAARLADFTRICDEVAHCRQLIRPELSDAYFAAIEYPVMATAAMNRKVLSEADASQQAYDDIQSLTARYNQMGGGKWRGLMDSAPRRLPVFSNAHARLTGKPAPVLISRNASTFDALDGDAHPVQMLGRSMSAMSLTKGSSLTYHFTIDATTGASATYSPASHGDSLNLVLHLIPTHPVDSGDLRFSIRVDNGEATTFSLKEPFRSEEWKQNVLRGAAIRRLPLRLPSGKHTMTICALDEHIVLDTWQIEAHPMKQR